jgi:hypothetical protein
MRQRFAKLQVMLSDSDDEGAREKDMRFTSYPNGANANDVSGAPLC